MNETCLRHPTKRASDPRENAGAGVVGLCAFSGTFRGLELTPSKLRYLAPPTSPHHPHQGATRAC